MFNKFSKIYDEIENKYNEVDRYISKIIEDSIDDTSKFFNEYFNNDSTLKVKNCDDPILLQLEQINKTLELLDFDTNKNWDSSLIYVATSLGHINENLTKILCKQYHIDIDNRQSYRINSLKKYLSRIVINDLYFINTFRNAILHPNDFDYNLFDLNEITKNKLFNEAKTAISKTYFIHTEVLIIKN